MPIVGWANEKCITTHDVTNTDAVKLPKEIKCRIPLAKIYFTFHDDKIRTEIPFKMERRLP